MHRSACVHACEQNGVRVAPDRHQLLLCLVVPAGDEGRAAGGDAALVGAPPLLEEVCDDGRRARMLRTG